MKKLLLFLSVLLCWTGLSARKLTYDFGVIEAEKGAVSYQFRLPAAKRTQTVVRTRNGCDCVRSEYPRRPVAAGKTVDITVTYDPTDQKGHFSKPVYVFYGDNRRDTLVVSGVVKRSRPKIDVSAYPTDLGGGMRIQTKTVDFGTMRPGQTKTVTVRMINSYEVGMQLDVKPAGEQASWLKIPYGLKLKGGQQAEFKVTLTVPADARRGAKPDLVLYPVINGMDRTLIPVSVRVR